MNIKAVPIITDNNESRFCIIDEDTGEVLDDCQGYGYKTERKAYASYHFVHRSTEKDKKKKIRQKIAQQWLKEHKSFAYDMDYWAFKISHGAIKDYNKFNATVVSRMLKINKLHPDCTPGDIYRAWKKGKE